jgi:hypothetical protein
MAAKAAPYSQRDNDYARAVVLSAGVPRLQQIYSNAVDPDTQNVLIINPRNVGVIRGFLVKVSGSIIVDGTDTDTATLSPLGISNALSNVQLTDFNNVTRINCPGWLLNVINSAKQPMVFAGAYAPNVPIGYGNNWDVMVAPSTIADTVSSAVQVYYYVPYAYAANDLRGAVWAGIVNATAQLQLTINPTPGVDATDRTSAIYYGSDGITWDGNVTVTVWQDYIDQIPTSGGAPILPMFDLSLTYQLQQTSLQGLVDGQDFPIPYANFRSFLSTTVVLDNGTTPFLNNGDEVNYFSLESANSSLIFKFGAEEAALMARNVFMADPPLGVYHFSHRQRPIDTQQFGNMQLNVNPNSSINAAAQLLVGFEFFATLNQVTYPGTTGPGSLPAG